MRRNEFSIEEQEEIRSFLEQQSFGYLGTVGEDGAPEITPLNYVYVEDHLYFHGSKVGQKMANLRSEKRVSFAVAEEVALIPSYFTDPHFACPATAFFKSVLIKGEARVLEDPERKAQVLSAFMKKLQPEGGYDPFSLEDPGYVSRIKAVAVVEIAVHELTAKFKFGQNLDQAKHEHIRQKLQERGLPGDEEAARLMAHFRKA
ncbi:pyridoxamine 5'-phosphate oxidase family protein [Gorillibacterium sp. CAU 1737]|uniref:pyridoxamine 5'-phosphate oxidase family protein n=1 Tax=Gorillibacterium sp. CAU 1737 TaxID=3140362 RepID=UPI0032610261